MEGGAPRDIAIREDGGNETVGNGLCGDGPIGAARGSESDGEDSGCGKCCDGDDGVLSYHEFSCHICSRHDVEAGEQECEEEVACERCELWCVVEVSDEWCCDEEDGVEYAGADDVDPEDGIVMVWCEVLLAYECWDKSCFL